MTGRDQYVLLLDRAFEIRHREVELGQLVRSDPDAHRVFGQAATEHFGEPDPTDAREFVDDVESCVVRQKLFVVGAIRRDERQQQQRKCELLLNGHALALDFLRKQCLRLGDAVLRQHVRHVELSADFLKYWEQTTRRDIKVFVAISSRVFSTIQRISSASARCRATRRFR